MLLFAALTRDVEELAIHHLLSSETIDICHQIWQYCLLVTARSLYMFRTLSASIIRSTKNCSSSHWCMSWVGMIYIQ